MTIDITKDCHCMHGVICHACHSRIESATAKRIVELVERMTAIEVNACTSHSQAIKGQHPDARVPLHRMHKCAANQSRALGNIIVRAIERGDWKRGDHG